MKKTAYDINYQKLPLSEVVTDPIDLLKLKLIAKFLETTKSMETKEILDITSLDRSDLSRLRVTNFNRFTVDRLIKLLDLVGCEVKLSFKKK